VSLHDVWIGETVGQPVVIASYSGRSQDRDPMEQVVDQEGRGRIEQPGLGECPLVATHRALRINRAGLRSGVAGITNDFEVRTRPGLMQFPGIAQRTNHVVASMHDDGGDDDGGDPVMATQQAHRLVVDPDVLIVIGHWRDDTTQVSVPIYQEAGLPLVELNPEREASRFDCLKGRLLVSSSPPEFEQAEVILEQSIKTDEASGAVVFAAQTRFYLAEILVKKGEIDRGLSLLHEIQMLFQDWGIPVWQEKCRQAKESMASLR